MNHPYENSILGIARALSMVSSRMPDIINNLESATTQQEEEPDDVIDVEYKEVDN